MTSSTIVAAGGVERIAAVFKALVPFEDTALAAGGALMNLAAHAGVAARVAAAGVVDVALAALEMQVDSSTVAQSAIGLLGNLAADQSSRAALIATARCVPAVLTVLATHGEHHDVAEYACKVLFHL